VRSQTPGAGPPPPPATPATPPSADESTPARSESDVEHTAELDDVAIEAGGAYGVTDPLDRAGDALDARPSRRARRTEKAESRARRRAEKASRRPAPAEALVATLPEIKPVYAAIITGALSGLAAVALAIGASRGCEAVRDTSSCGGGVGLLALVAILAIEVLIGASLLRAWRISDPFSTSFLGVGLVAINAMLFFLDSLDSVWMLLVIPVLTAAAFLLSWWVTVRIIDEEDRFESDEEDEEEEIGQDEDSNA
jgi:hypothetical protein